MLKPSCQGDFTRLSSFLGRPFDRMADITNGLVEDKLLEGRRFPMERHHNGRVHAKKKLLGSCL